MLNDLHRYQNMLKFNQEDRGDYVEAKMNKKKEKMDIRKYVNYCLMMVAVILLAVIGAKLYHTYKDNKLGESEFARMGGTIQYDDVENTTSEMPTDGFILISYIKNEDVKNFEQNLKKTVVNNELQNNFYYLDATEMMLEDDYLDSLNSQFKLEGRTEIQALPAILYYREGKLKATLTSTKTEMLSAEDFDQLLDSYEINKTK